MSECSAYDLFQEFMLSCLIFKYLSHFEFIFMCDERLYSWFSPAFCPEFCPVLSKFCPAFLMLLAKETFYHCKFLPPLWKINWPWVCAVLLGSLFCSMDPYMSVSVLVPCCFDYCVFVVLSDIWDGYGSYFVLFLQDSFGNLKTLMAPYKF